MKIVHASTHNTIIKSKLYKENVDPSSKHDYAYSCNSTQEQLRLVLAEWIHSSAGEHLLDVQGVGGSSPSESTMNNNARHRRAFFMAFFLGLDIGTQVS